MTHSLFVREVCVWGGGGNTFNGPFVDEGARGAKALGGPSETGEEAFEVVDILLGLEADE